jgi:hypothetical protein
MGEVELNTARRLLTIRSHIVTYGNAADEVITEGIRSEIEQMWNQPEATVYLHHDHFGVKFSITASISKELDQMEVLQNTDPRNNYFRIENFIHGNISFVDGLGSNSGYFLTDNLYEGSTTAAHEYGHTLGLDHPSYLDLRGQGVPGIMYPRGTLVDPPFQYDPSKPAGITGGTMHPMYRKVKLLDIENLKLHRLRFENGRAVIGEFTNIFHWNHADMNPQSFTAPPIRG